MTGVQTCALPIFTKSFPRCGVPDAYGTWSAYRSYLEFLIATNSIIEDTQVWWSIRPHLAFGTVEVRICDVQSTAAESDALSALITACVLQAARDEDDGVPFADLPPRLIEENMWRAIRHGRDGLLIDLDRAEEFTAADAAARLLDWTAPVRAEQQIDPVFPDLNGAQRQRAMRAEGASLHEVFTAVVEETRRTFSSPEEVPSR